MQNIERLASGEDFISEFNDVQQLIEKGEEYYDSLGLALSMAVLNNNSIVLSSKHWLKNYYIEVQQIDDDEKFVFGLWDVIITVSREINRELERNPNETNFVFITKLNREQTAKVYESVIQELNNRKLDFDVVEQYNLFGWNANNANTIKIPWIVGIDYNKFT